MQATAVARCPATTNGLVDILVIAALRFRRAGRPAFCGGWPFAGRRLQQTHSAGWFSTRLHTTHSSPHPGPWTGTPHTPHTLHFPCLGPQLPGSPPRPLGLPSTPHTHTFRAPTFAGLPHYQVGTLPHHTCMHSPLHTPSRVWTGIFPTCLPSITTFPLHRTGFSGSYRSVGTPPQFGQATPALPAGMPRWHSTMWTSVDRCSCCRHFHLIRGT